MSTVKSKSSVGFVLSFTYAPFLVDLVGQRGARRFGNALRRTTASYTIQVLLQYGLPCALQM